MNKTFIIIQREFMNRASKKSFILLTILMPFIFAATVLLPVMLAMVKSDEAKEVVVVDQTGKYLSQFQDNESYHFVPGSEMKEEYRTDTSGVSAVVMITDDLIKDPSAAVIYSRKEIPNSLSRIVNEALNTQIRHDKLIHYNIPQLQDIMKDFDQTYSIRTVKWSEDGSVQESNSGLATASGMVLTILIYIFVLSYGGMVMQSVMEEKTNRIVELMVSSVKPFQLMIGKIIGIGLVGIVQLCIWGIMLTAILAVAGSMLGIAALQSPDTAQMMAMEAPTSDAASLVAALHNLNLAKMGTLFVLNFVGGYLIYASIFAAIGVFASSFTFRRSLLPTISSIVRTPSFAIYSRSS